MNVSAGLADFDPRLSATYSNVMGPFIAKYIQTMLHDSSISWNLDPISPECRKEKSCVSYLVAGPYETISPWPFTNEDAEVNMFRVYEAPFYQVDLWYPPPSLTVGDSRDCTVYGGINRTTDFSIDLCITQQSSPNLIAASWKSCQSGIAANGTCLMPGSNPDKGWSTYASFYRRNATITFSRADYTIQEVTRLSTPSPLAINTSSLFDSLNSVLYRPDQPANDPRFDLSSQPYVLTAYIASRLWYSLNSNAVERNDAQDLLRNILVFPLYVFQPTLLAFSSNLAPLSADNGSAVQPNLPAQNYVKGAYCVSDTRAIPSLGTVLAYAIVGAIVLLLIGAGKIVACFCERVDISAFPQVDFGVLATVVGRDGKETSLEECWKGKQYDTGRVLEEVGALKVGIRRSRV
jgi:hypothetical protein